MRFFNRWNATQPGGVMGYQALALKARRGRYSESTRFIARVKTLQIQ